MRLSHELPEGWDGMAEFAPAAEHDANKLKPSQASPAGADGKLEAGVADVDSANLASIAAPNGRPPAPRAPASQLLRMQRSAGNQAVAGLLRRQTQKSVVRPPVAPSNGTLAAPPSGASELVAEPAAQAESGVPAPPVMRSTLIQREFGDSVLGTVAGWANEIPGYHLMTLILGRDPISGATVERNATNVVHGILSIVPGGNKTFENLQQSGALDRFFDWVSGEIGKLGLSFESIKQLFKQAWDALSVTDLLEPSEAWNKVKGIFGPPLGRIKDFALDAGKKVLEFIVEGVLKLAGPLGEQVMALLRKGADIFNKIVEDPIGFLGNLLKAVKGGFEGFMDHIAEHLKNGLMGWLFGALAGAGLTLPKSFDLKGILSLVLQVLGLTYQNLRAKLVAAFGEKTVGYLETAVGFVKTLVTEGLAGAWKMIVEWVGSLKDMVLGAIQDWVITSIVKAAVTKLITMFNPVGAIIQGIITIYNTISFFIERAQQIGAVASSIFDSVGRIAAGDVGGAAQFVEQTMAKAVPVMIGFLASLIGLGGIGNTIRGIIQKIQAPINTALDKLVGFVKTKAQAVIGKLKGTGLGNAAAKVKGKIREAASWAYKKLTASITAGGEHHTISAEAAGNRTRVMVASTPIEIDAYIAHLETRADSLKNVPPSHMSDIRRYIHGTRRAAERIVVLRPGDPEAEQLLKSLIQPFKELHRLINLHGGQLGKYSGENVAVGSFKIIKLQDYRIGETQESVLAGTIRGWSGADKEPPLPSHTIFQPRDLGDKVDHSHDTERKIFEIVAERIVKELALKPDESGRYRKVRGELSIVSDFPVCHSCQDVKKQFEAKFVHVTAHLDARMPGKYIAGTKTE
jgi:hypothetical protein